MSVDIVSTRSNPNEVTPVISTDVFRDIPEARFWVGEVATHGEVIYPEEFRGARVLSANVYIDEMRFLEPSFREADGGETDEDDSRSVQFAILENRHEDGEVRVVGRSRLILKDSKDNLLPVEQIFPEAFDDAPAPVGSYEASRFISRHPDQDMTQHLVAFAGIRAMDLYAVKERSPFVYAVIEEPLRSRFEFIGIPYEVISDPRPVSEYNGTVNMAVRIDPEKVLDTVTDEDIAPERMLLKQFFENTLIDMGLGYYDRSLMKRITT